MSKFLLHTVRFFLIALAAFFALSTWASYNRGLEKLFFGSPTYQGATFLRMPELRAWAQIQTDRQKILFLGPSTLYRGVNPAVLENSQRTVFNGGSSGQRLLNSYYLLRQVEDWGAVDWVVLDVFPRLWGGGSGVESARDLIVNNPDFPAPELTRMAFATGDVRNIWLAAFYSVKRGLYGRRELKLQLPPGDEYRGHGFVYSQDKEWRSIHVPEKPRELSASQRRHLEQIRRYCQKHDLALTLLIPPEIRPTPWRANFADNLPVIDAQEAPVDSALFYDNHHLLGTGAQVYSRWLRDQLFAKPGR